MTATATAPTRATPARLSVLGRWLPLWIGLAMIVGYVQWSLGYSPWSLSAVPIGIVIILCLHVASIIGQGLSADQMTLLRGRLDRALEMAFGNSHH